MTATPGLDEIFTRALATVSRQWKRRLDMRFRDLRLSQARWGVLLELSRHAEVTQIELARALGIEGATLVRLLDGLEAAGLVERQPCPEDRRAKKLHLTAKAMPLLDRMKRIAAASRAEILADIPPEDLRTATQVLERIAARLEMMGNDENG
ncbi:MAG: MarR family transcriptional regulator [Roseovarius sp.]|nr:MarR family transcriptional regulator [Roseovarius sp.]